MDLRQYDPAIARWTVMDPIIHHSMSPYNAFDNNPVYWADPSGGNSISSALSNLFSWENRFHYNWDSGTYSMFGNELSSNAVASLLETARNTDLTISLDPENSTGNGGVDQQKGVLRVLFDGNKIYVIDAIENIIGEYYATSGKGKYMNKSEHQHEQNLGPIPEGEYMFLNKDWEFQSPFRQLYNLITFQGDWGYANIPLKPITYQGDRHSFYIHGGSYSGSAGCIDLLRNIIGFYNLVQHQSTTYLTVKYN